MLDSKQKQRHIRWSALVAALEGREGLDVREGGGVPYPLDGLPGGHQPHVFHGRDSVQEQLKSLLGNMTSIYFRVVQSLIISML